MEVENNLGKLSENVAKSNEQQGNPKTKQKNVTMKQAALLGQQEMIPPTDAEANAMSNMPAMDNVDPSLTNTYQEFLDTYPDSGPLNRGTVILAFANSERFIRNCRLLESDEDLTMQMTFLIVLRRFRELGFGMDKFYKILPKTDTGIRNINTVDVNPSDPFQPGLLMNTAWSADVLAQYLPSVATFYQFSSKLTSADLVSVVNAMYRGFEHDAWRNRIASYMISRKIPISEYMLASLTCCAYGLRKGNRVSISVLSKLKGGNSIKSTFDRWQITERGWNKPTYWTLCNPFTVCFLIGLGAYTNPVKNVQIDPVLAWPGGSCLCINEVEYAQWKSWSSEFSKVISGDKNFNPQQEVIERYGKLGYDSRLVATKCDVVGSILKYRNLYYTSGLNSNK